MIYSNKWAYGGRTTVLVLLLSLFALLGYAQSVNPGTAINFSNAGNNATAGFATTYVLTDNSGNIMQQVSSGFAAPGQAGNYRIYAVNYSTSGTAPTLTPGTNITAIGGSCTDISDNPILFSVQGACVSSGTAINFSNAGNNATAGFATTYVLTDNSGIIMQQVTSGFAAPNQSGTFKVYAVNYSTSGTAPTLSPGTDIAAIGGSCTDVSDNPLVFCVEASCVNPGSQISFSGAGNNTSSGYATTYVLTNSTGIIQNTVTSPFNAPSQAGAYKVYAVNYNTSGTAPNLSPGTDIAAIGGSCADVSDNPLEFSVCAVTSISGTLHHDANGLTDGAVNGTQSNIPASGQPFFVSLVNPATGTIIQTVPVASDGTYQFSNLSPNTQYKLVLTNSSAGSTTSPFNTPGMNGWASTGEFAGTGAGSDGTPNGELTLTTPASGTTPVAMGLQKAPTANGATPTITAPAVGQVLTLNGVGSNPPVPSGNDQEDGSLGAGKTLVITSVPTNATMNYNGQPVTNGQVIPNFDPNLLTITFTSASAGASNTSFQYAYQDAAGVQSAPATYTISWDGPLPVKLISFTTVKKSDYVQLLWSTVEETNSDRFEIERSLDGRNWSMVGSVNATNQGSGRRSYFYNDFTSLQGTLLYRLKMIDTDGSFEYSVIRSVSIHQASLDQSPSIYPNPATHEVHLNSTLVPSVRKVSILSTEGRTILTCQPTDGVIDVRSVPTGFYLLQVETLIGTSSNYKLIIQR